MLLTIYSYWSYKILPIKVSTMQRSLVFYNVWFILVIYVTDYFFNHRKIIIHEKGEKKIINASKCLVLFSLISLWIWKGQKLF